MAKYELEDKERELLESVFSMAQRVVDLQYDDAIAEALQSILMDSAELFDIEMNEMILNEEPAVKKTEKPRWTPKVISNDDEPN